MDDTYPNTHPPKHRRPFPSLPTEQDSDEGNYVKSISDDDEDGGDAGGGDEEEQRRNQRNSVDLTPEIPLKRRRGDRYAQGFEFVPRAAPPPKPAPVNWSEEATIALIEAWGDRFLSNGRRKLHSDQWSQVVRLVNEVSGTAYSESDCRSRIEDLRKRYEKEKARGFGSTSSGSGNRKWAYFAKMDELMRAIRLERKQEIEIPTLRYGVDNGEYVFRQGQGDDDDGDDDGDDGGHDAVNNDGMNGNGLSSYNVLADSVKRFGEICERLESNRKKQVKEMKKMRKEIQMELEARKREIFERTQAEITKIEDRYDDDGDDDNDDDDDDGDSGGNSSD